MKVYLLATQLILLCSLQLNTRINKVNCTETYLSGKNSLVHECQTLLVCFGQEVKTLIPRSRFNVILEILKLF